MRLEDKVAIVTGGASGIGRATAERFAREGAKVVIADVDATHGPEAAQGITQSGGEASFVRCDVSKAADVEALIRMTVETYGKLDILFNNAGNHIPKTVDETSEEEWDGLMTLNLKGVFLGCKVALPELRKTRGAIVNTASMVGLVGQPNAVAYCATKGGVIAMTRALALDLAPEGIRVNCVCPAGVATPLMERWIQQQPDPDESRRAMDAMHPLGWTSTPEEIAATVLFLVSDDASFITGQALQVEGGSTLGYRS